MNNWDGKERRKCPRYPINKGVQLKLQDDLERHSIRHYGYGENIGLGGIRVKLWQYKDVKCPEIKEGARIQVKMPVWGAKKYLELSGQVIWCSYEGKDEELGIQFLSSDNKGNEALLYQLRTMNK